MGKFHIFHTLHKKFVFFFPFLGAIFLLIFPPITDLIQADSASYIDFHTSRTIAYPALLWFVNRVSGSLKSIHVIQLFFFAAGCTFLAQRIYRLRPTHFGFFLTLVAIGVIMGHPEIMKYHFQAMTESFSLSILLFILGLWIDFIEDRRSQTISTISIMIGVGILLRPSGYASISLLVLALWLVGREAFRPPLHWLEAVIAPLALMIILGSTANYMVHGFWGTQTFLGHTLIGKVAFVMRPDIVTPEPEKYSQLYQAVLPIQRVVEKLPSTSHMSQLLRAPYYDVVRYKILNNIFPADHDWNNVWRDMAFAVIKDNPRGYLQDVVDNYAALWIYPQVITHEEVAAFRKDFETMSPLPYIDHYPFKLLGVSGWFALLVHLSFSIAFFISIYSLLGVLVAPKLHWIALAAGGSWLIHSHFLLTACVQAGLTRYATSMWPAVVVTCMIFLMQLINKFCKPVVGVHPVPHPVHPAAAKPGTT